MIDTAHFEVKPAVYFRDLLMPMAAFAAAFAWCANASGWPFVVAFAIATISIHRAGIFGHEVAHRTGNRRLRAFNRFWNLTVGALILVPSARFVRPHMIHHSTGKFRTKEDPQYLLLRGDRKLSVFVFVFIPPIMPIFASAITVTAAIGGIAAEEAVETFLLRRGMPTGSVLPARHKREVMLLSRYYLAFWTLYALMLPATLPLMYAIQVAAWYLVTWRIPLEHRMESRLETSHKRDQVADSFTVESPFAELLQPLALKYHTAHHMFPGVPYHNLPALHAELKATDPVYRRSVVTIRDIFRGVPEHARTADVGG
ncbi:MAG: fatty acid desaturase [Thalassobaculum sp.]